MTLLLGGEQGEVYQSANRKPEEPKNPFALPNAHTDMRRTYAYLVKSRHIDREIVTYFAREKLLYESCETSKDGSKEYHNAIFVGLDENGIPRHAHKRGIYIYGDSFKGNVDSSSPAYSFHFIGTSNQLFVFEAPIDMLSYISLYPQEWQKHSYVCLCGVAEHAMLKTLELHPKLNHIVLCLDNDPAGIEACEKYYDLLSEKRIQCTRKKSIHKDWNEDIKAAKGLCIIPAEPHPQQVILDSVLSELKESLGNEKREFPADMISSKIQIIRNHLQGKQTEEAKALLQEVLRCAVSKAVKEHPQANHEDEITKIVSRLQYGFKTYENRGQIQTRWNLLEKDMGLLQGYKRILSTTEKEELANLYESIAAHCLKAVILLEEKQQKQEQKKEQKQCQEMIMK